jgi:hypothetical protein
MSEDQELAQIEAELLALEAAVIEAAKDGPIVELTPEPIAEPVTEPVAEKPKRAKKPKKESVAAEEVKVAKVPDPVKVEKEPVLFGAAKLKAKFLRR